MGKASREKKERSLQRRARPELLVKLRQQVDLLRELGKVFDAGNPVMGFPLSTTIRVLVHDTGASHALLAQLGDLSSMGFLDTSLPFIPGNLLLAHGGLVTMRMTGGVGSAWIPRRDAPPFPGAPHRHVPFGTWWKTDNTSDAQGTKWSRCTMVLAIANKEGGAHIDPSQPVDLKAIEIENSMGWTYSDPIVSDQPMSNGPLMPSIRQIAYELEESLTKHFANDL